MSLSIVGILLTLILYYCLTYVMYLNIDDVDSHLHSTRRYNSSSDAVFLDGRFLLDVVKVYSINAKMHMYHVLSWGKFIILQHSQVTITMHQCFRIAKTGVVIHCSVCISFLCLWVGLPVINNLTWIFVAFVTSLKL